MARHRIVVQLPRAHGASSHGWRGWAPERERSILAE
jgi:hypothetical protein